MRTGLALMGFGFVVARFGLFLREIAAAGQVMARPHSSGLELTVYPVAHGLIIVFPTAYSFFQPEGWLRVIVWLADSREITRILVV
jgi:uncharacterized membrane protein YidH (DUF202 family)